MRKQDYETLARAIKGQREHCRAQGKPLGDQALTALAYTLARALHVDRAAFLTACGIRP